jgi:thiamine-monophosphate kinase
MLKAVPECHGMSLDPPQTIPLDPSVADLGEEAVVSRLVAMIPPFRGVIAGPGDDCAAVEVEDGSWQLLKTDCVVEGVHFLPGTDPVLVGRKAMNRVLSDLAAMGGRPAHALVTIAVEAGRSFAEVEGWYAGMVEAAEEGGCGIVGGETSRMPVTGAMITVAMTGTVDPEQCVFRSGAKPGDLIAVTGKLGGSFASGRHLTFTPRLRESQWLAAHAKPTAMMDLSDGLGSDLPRLAAASGVGFRIEEASLPCHDGVSAEGAICDGEDYELLMTFSPDTFRDLPVRWSEVFPDLELTVIGEITATTTDAIGRGWEHYRT